MSNIIGFSGLLLLCLAVGSSVCFQFDNSYGEKNIYANTSGEATIAFRYTTGNEIRAKTKIECGYIEKANLKLVVLVTKEGDNNPRPLNPSGNVVSGRASLFTDPKQSNVIGMKIRDIRKTDPVQYKCQASFVASDSTADTTDSNLKILQVLDPPKFKDCLGSINPSRVTAGNPVSFTCSVTGNPIPFLQCDLLRYDGSVIQSTENKKENISSQFSRVDKNADAIRCVAKDEKTGRAELKKPIIVFHKPFAPKNLTQLASPNPTSMRIRWKGLLTNETGESLYGYKVWWYTQGMQESINRTHKELRPSDPGQVGVEPGYTSEKFNGELFLLYTIQNLVQNNKYIVWVVGFNNLGDGDMYVDPVTGQRPVLTAGIDPSYSPSSGDGGIDENLAAIIGGVIGGVVLLVLIVILIIWLSKRTTSPTKSKYPTSYVEDAIDYPPNQGQSLYAGIEKNKNGYATGDDYRDNEKDNNYELRQQNFSSYEQSDKAYV